MSEARDSSDEPRQLYVIMTNDYPAAVLDCTEEEANKYCRVKFLEQQHASKRVPRVSWRAYPFTVNDKAGAERFHQNIINQKDGY